MSTAGSARAATEGEDRLERRVTPLELFFDLVFVFALTQVERTRSKSAGLPTSWIEGDARAFDLGDERFRLIFLTGKAF